MKHFVVLLPCARCFCLFWALLACLCWAGISCRARADTAVASDGAVGVNADWEQRKSSLWYIELQRTGADYIRDGVPKKDAASISTGIRILTWGFSHEASDGSFPGTAGGGVGQMFHSTSIFMEAAARAALTLQAYNASKYKSTLSAWRAKLAASGTWMTRADVVAAGQLYNDRYTHRRYLLAAALAQTAAFTNKVALNPIAASYARDGLSLMLPKYWRAFYVQDDAGYAPPAVLLSPDDPDPLPVTGLHVLSTRGVNPELGGYDAAYQSTGVQFAERYYPYCTDTNLKSGLLDMIDRACLWEAARIDSHGVVRITGSTRIGRESDRGGVTKIVNPASIKSVLQDAYALTGDTRLRDAANALDLDP